MTDVPDLHFGATGVLLVAHLVGVQGLEDRLRARIRGNVRNEAWELMSGSAGTILAARVAGMDAEAAESAAVLEAEWDDETGLWTQTLDGKPAQYIGPAHGLAGNVHALRGFRSDAELRERIEPILRRYAQVEDGLVNWPPVSGDTLTRVQWCHGAAGIVATVADLMPSDLLLGGAELTWRAGPVAKGAGLCHGTAGNGYAFLKAHAVTGDDVWLDRARRFAMHALEQVEAERKVRAVAGTACSRATSAQRSSHVPASRVTRDFRQWTSGDARGQALERGSRPLPRRRDHEGRPVRLLRRESRT